MARQFQYPSLCKKFISPIFIILGYFNAYNQIDFHSDFHFTERQADSIHIKLDSIFIIGIGTSASQFFLEDVNNRIIQKLKDKNITASYVFWGQHDNEAINNFEAMDKKGYKAILLFMPTDTAFFGVKTYFTFPYPVYGPYSSNPNIGYGAKTISTKISRLRYQQTFDVSMILTDKIKGIFWNATVEIDCNPRKESKSNKVAEIIFNALKKHNYIP